MKNKAGGEGRRASKKNASFSFLKRAKGLADIRQVAQKVLLHGGEARRRRTVAYRVAGRKKEGGERGR